ncbi:MAG: DUF362 domain-containing protein, partial [Candidatus Bathyarchaeota archaeon]|nr:DUF362 domain-containing protein [Candidatus Bathyarchaeota archaeon]
MKRASSRVALVRGQRSLQTVKKALNSIGACQKLVDKPVLIKVNFITTKTWDTGATTDPIIVEALIQEIGKVNDRVFVVESDATVTRADRAAEATGMLELCNRYGTPFINLSKIKDKITI